MASSKAAESGTLEAYFGTSRVDRDRERQPVKARLGEAIARAIGGREGGKCPPGIGWVRMSSFSAAC